MPALSVLGTKLLFCSWAGLAAFGGLAGEETELGVTGVSAVAVWGGVFSLGVALSGGSLAAVLTGAW